MEPYINNNVSDITYTAELILDILRQLVTTQNVKDLIRTDNLLDTIVFVSYVLIKGG